MTTVEILFKSACGGLTLADWTANPPAISCPLLYGEGEKVR